MNLLVLEQRPSFVGGSERMSLAIAKHALKRGHRVWLLHDQPGDMIAAYAGAGAMVRQRPARPIAARRPLEAMRSAQALTSMIRRENIDVVFSSHVQYTSLLSLATRLTSARSALHLGLIYDFPSPIFRAGMQRIDVAIAPSEHLAQEWRAREWPEKSLRVVENGVDTSTFNEGDGRRSARRRLDIHETEGLIAYVGRLVKEKGIFTALRGFAQYRRNGGTARLLFVGPAPGEETQQLRQTAHDERLPDAAWEMRPQTSTPEDVYRAADLVIVPSEWNEPFGLAPVESLACGTLCVVSDRGVMPEFVAPLNGLAVFPAGDASALAARLSYWMSDASRRETAAIEMADRARVRYGFDRCGDAYLSEFARISQ